MDQPIFSNDNRVRLIYLVGDLLEKPRPHSLGGYEGGEDFFALDELLRRHLGRLHLQNGSLNPLDTIPGFIQTAPEKELLDLIERLPHAKALGAKRSGSPLRRETNIDLVEMRSSVNEFLQRIGSPARFSADGNFHRDAFEIVAASPLAHLPKKGDLEQDLQGLLSQQELVSVILLDLDGFKGVNETHGYPEGDKCLEAVTSVTAKAIARKGRIYRFREGDEFAVVLRNTTTAEAKATAERIRREIEERNPGVDIKITASIGIASSEERTLGSTEKLLNAAEEALHVSKHTTKNCVNAWPVSIELLAAAGEKQKEAERR
jgi:diguanylate cyclase (GGDEF)-like protein